MNNNKKSNGISRKDFLKQGMAASAMFTGAGLFTGSCTREEMANPGDAKNIIFLVVDGMSHGTFALGDLVKHRQFGERSHWMELYNSDRNFHRGVMDMASLDSPVTDSAAASSSWGCGNRVNNRAVCMGPNGEKYPPILQVMKQAGKKTGMVTTARITHATPAGFAANIDHRDKEDQIAEQYLQRKYDLLMGGGSRHFDPNQREDGKDLHKAYSDNGYTVVHDKKGLANAEVNKPLLGTFSEAHMPYALDRSSSKQLRKTVPNLAEMTETALSHLSGHPDGFFLQVEGGRVDHGGHDNDAGALIYDQIDFDEALKVALDFYDGRDDTLLIITTDHGTGNPGLSGAGEDYSETATRFDRIQGFSQTNDWILSGVDHNSSENEIRDRMVHATNLDIEKEHADMMQKALREELQTPYYLKNEIEAVLGSILANYTSINFIGTNHTADYVELSALGPGVETLDHFTRNTELFDLMVEAAGVEVQR